VDGAVDQHAECTDWSAGRAPEVERTVGDPARALGLAEAVGALLRIGMVEAAQPIVSELVELLREARGPVADVIPIRRRG
jgi:hypothetical protein